MKKSKFNVPFAAIPRCFLADPRIRAPELSTFSVLVSMTNANDNVKKAWPSQATLGEYQKKKRGAMGNHLKHLEGLGVIVRHGSKWQSICYEIVDPFMIYGHMCFWTWNQWQEYLEKVSAQDIKQGNIFFDEAAQMTFPR